MLHNLRRVEAGLRGENLGEDLKVWKHGEGLDGGVPGSAMVLDDDDDGVGLAKGDANASEEHVYYGDRALLRGKLRVGETMEGEWQDKSEFERQQEVVQGDVGKRHNAVERGVEGDGGGNVPHVQALWSPEDRPTRRNEKKERKKKEQKEREAQRQKRKDAEQG